MQIHQFLAQITFLILGMIMPEDSLKRNMLPNQSWLLKDFSNQLWFYLVLENISTWEWLIFIDQKYFEDDISVIWSNAYLLLNFA